MSSNLAPYAEESFFQAFDDEIREEWEKYKLTEEYRHAKPEDHRNKLYDEIVALYRKTKTSYNWRFLPGAQDGFALLRDYCAIYEPNVDRTVDIDDFIECIKERPEKVWNVMYARLKGAKELHAKKGLSSSIRSNTIVNYAQYSGFENYEGEEITIDLEINSGKELDYFKNSVHTTMLGRYYNCYAGDWIDQDGAPKEGFEELSISAYTSIDNNPLKNSNLRINTNPWNGDAQNCPICNGWFNKKAGVQFTEDEVKDMSKAEILAKFAVAANNKRKENNEKRRRDRENFKGTYEERIRESIAKAKREMDKRDRYRNTAFNRCANVGIDLGPDENGKEPSFISVKQHLLDLIQAQVSPRSKRSLELTLNHVQKYYCYVLVDKDACDGEDVNG
jgi:hypothetical protein